MTESSPPAIIRLGENCWRCENASRIAFAVDGEAYFRAVREALLQATKTVFILGWDIHSELLLVRDAKRDDYPRELGPLLDYIARDRGVEVYVLSWDFAMIYLLEREHFPLYALNWKTHSRVHFHMDASHPVGASQHQKLVVVDDAVAFCGGFDLSKWRWDTPEHRLEDERRTDPDGKPYPPFHDLQMVVAGTAASALGELARDRWQRATGRNLSAPRQLAGGDPWPASLQAVERDVQVAIARTYPAYEGREAVAEIESLYLDGIAAASEAIYMENQYLTSHSVGEALAQRLAEPEGPEVVIVLPRETGGWLEQQTMDVVRSRLVDKLRKADRHHRLRIYYPRLAAADEVALMVHAKLMIVDEALLLIGSANLSNRSMGLDSECNLALEAGQDEQLCGAIRQLRSQLLAEHLGVDPGRVDETLDGGGGLIEAIESLYSDGRTLEPLDASVDPTVDELVPESALIDPEQPIDPGEMLSNLVPEEQQSHSARRAVLAVATLALLLGLAAAWRWTELGDWLGLDSLIHQARTLSSHPAAPLLVVAVFALASSLAVPLTLLVVAAVLAFGALEGFLYSLVGALLSALLSYRVGRSAGRDLVRRYAGKRLNSVSRQLSERGILAIVTLRIVPVAPYAVINLVAGASHISLRDFAIGTSLGLLPGLAAIALFGEGLEQSLRDPDPGGLAWLAALVLAVVALTLWLRRLLSRRQGQS
jgi:phosphatidylserine/phosphatidylglycerophosphate/cardiolipin synthase-like enzyme/uncharacterized membrane protein YdjX (TVP38/TMEM64 family)